MEKTINGILATAMDNYIRDLYENIEDETVAECVLEEWLRYGVPDDNDLSDNILAFGEEDDFFDLQDNFVLICNRYNLTPFYGEYVEKIFNQLRIKLHLQS